MTRHNDRLAPAREILQDVGIKAPSNVELRLIESAADIRQGPAEEISFQHTVLCQTGLPYRATSERRWERRNGRVTLEVEAGRAYHPQKQQFFDLPLPFGPKARLIMIHLNSEAVRTRERVIEVEDSMTAYIRLLQGREPNGKEIRKFKDQLSALSAAVIRMATAIDGRAFQVTTTIVEKFDLWFPKDASQRVLWPTTVELSDSYFQSLLNHAVPLDQRAVAALAHNAMALDIYAWLAQRLCRISQVTPALVPWVSLHEQFGHGYESVRKFRQVFLHTLKTCVVPAYPDAKIEATPQGLILKTSPPPIGRKAISTGSLVR
jgi:hypothetical protein